MKVLWRFLIAAALLALVCTSLISPALAHGYFQVNNVSDIPGLAKFTDPDLVNPWGLVAAPNGQLWVANNGTGVATVYNPDGTKVPRTITIPGPGGFGPSAPTGEVYDVGCDFIMKNANGTATATALFIWDTEDGTIAAWNPALDPTNAFLQVDNSAMGTVYKGLALCPQPKGKSLLFATNFTGGVVEAYDTHFNFLFSFTDVQCTSAGFSPFGIRCINNLVYVTYALPKFPGSKDDQAGPGNGFVVVFNMKGKVVQRLIAHGPLNSPWGLALSPGKFGIFSNMLLVGNFGDGRINAFDIRTGFFVGTVTLPDGRPIVNSGLWGIDFLPNNGLFTDKMYFNAGLNDEADGLHGFLFPSPSF